MSSLFDSRSDWAFIDVLHKAKTGFQDAIGQLLTFFQPFLSAKAEQLIKPDLRTKASPSDLVQGACLIAWEKFASFRGSTEEELKAWLSQIIVNHFRDIRRHFAQCDKRLLAREIPLADDHSVVEAKDQAPDEEVLKREAVERMWQAFQEIDPAHQLVLCLRYDKALAYQEIGRQLGCSDVWARSLCGQAMKELVARFNLPAALTLK